MMAGIQGINGVPEPTPERPAPIRDRKRDEGGARIETQQDNVRISSEAKQAANIQRIIQQTETESEIRPERVEAARQAIERGDYKDINILREVARNLLKYLT